MPSKRNLASNLLFIIAFMQVVVATLFLINRKVIITTTTQLYHVPVQNLPLFLNELIFGISILHVALAFIFVWLAYGVRVGKKRYQSAVMVISFLTIAGALFFSSLGYLRIFPINIIPYAITIIVINTILMIGASVISIASYQAKNDIC